MGKLHNLKIGFITKLSEMVTLQSSYHQKIATMLDRGPDLMDLDRVNSISDRYRLALDHYNLVMGQIRSSLSSPPTETEVQSQIDNTNTIMDTLHELILSLKECEAMYVKYSVPGIEEFPTFEAYVSALRVFMGVWREEAEKRREKGERSLIEWIRKLGESEDEDKRFTFSEMKSVVIDLGSRVSNIIGKYFLLMEVCIDEETLEGKFNEMEFTLRRLRVEENSVFIIDKFLLAVKYVMSEIKKRQQERCSPVVVDEERSSVVLRSDALLIHMIFREALRVEVAFCCPDLAMMLINEVFLGMKDFMMVCVFEKRLSGMSSKIAELETGLLPSINDQDPERAEFVKMVLNGVKEIWDNLEMDQSVH